MIVNLDVTLRDGGYRNNFDFPLEYALHHARESVAAGMEWVEIGYRNGSFKPKPGIGRTGVGADAYIRAVAEVISPDRLCMILHPKNITGEDLPRMYEAGIRLLRFCLPANTPEPGLAMLSEATDLGFTATVNITPRQPAESASAGPTRRDVWRRRRRRGLSGRLQRQHAAA